MAVTHKPQSGKGRMFENDILEALSKTSAVVAYTYYPIAILGMVAVNLFHHDIAWKICLGFFVWGALFFSFFEYVVHRFLYHIDDKGSDKMKRFAERYHGIHHDYPQDKERLIMPPFLWTILVSALLALAYLIGGHTSFSFIGGLGAGYLAYIYVHFQVHSSNPPKWLRGQMLHHAKHHYQHEDKAFGVSSTLWDKIFGTMPPK